MAEANALDKFISFFSPKAGAERAKFRLVQERLEHLKKRQFDGAAVSRRTDGWKSASTSADAEIHGALYTLRNRSRELIRNDGYSQRALRILHTNIVGTGIVPQARGSSKKRNNSAADLWKDWAETEACDAQGIHNIYGLQNIAARATPESGECLILRVRAKSSQGLPVPLQLKIVEADYIDTYSRSGQILENGNVIKQGIEYDSNGKPQAYYLFERHPGDTVLAYGKLLSQRIPAEDVIHVRRMDRPGQGRGIPWSAPVMLRTRDFNDYDDALLFRQKIANCFAAFVYDSEESADLDAARDPNAPPLADKLEPGIIEQLPPGKDIKFANPPEAGESGFSIRTLRSIAVGWGVTYEDMTGDYSNVNFSSARMARQQFKRDLADWQWNMFIPQVCARIWRWFIEASALTSQDLEGTFARWTTPRMEMVDPTAETNAMQKQIRMGVKTLAQAIRENGDDPDEILEEIAETNQKLDDKGIVLDSDPRHITGAGINQPPGENNLVDGKETPAAAAPANEKGEETK